MPIRPPIRIAQDRTPSGLTLAGIYGLDNISRAVLSSVVSINGLELFGSAYGLSISFFISSIVCIPIILSAGFLIQVFSRRILFSISCLVAFMSVPLFLLNTTEGFILANIFRMGSAGIIMMCISLYTMDFISKNQLASAESRKIFMAGGAYVLFPGIGTWSYVNIGQEAPYLLSGGFIILLGLVFWILRIKEAEQIRKPKEKHLSIRKNLMIYFRNPHMRIAYLIALARSSAWVVFFIYGPVYLLNLGIETQYIGFIMGAIISILFFSSYFARLATFLGIRQTIFYSFLLSGVCFAFVGILPPSIFFGILLLVIATLGIDMLDIIGNIPFMRMVTPKIRTEMTTVFSTWREFSLVLTPGISALILTIFSVSGVFSVLGFVLIASAFLTKGMPLRVD